MWIVALIVIIASVWIIYKTIAVSLFTDSEMQRQAMKIAAGVSTADQVQELVDKADEVEAMIPVRGEDGWTPYMERAVRFRFLVLARAVELAVERLGMVGGDGYDEA